MRIVWVKGWIGATDGKGTMFLNRHLKKHPKILKQVLKHEKEHTEGSKIRIKDLKIDLIDSGNPWLFFFQLRHPEALIPIQWWEGNVAVMVVPLLTYIIWAMLPIAIALYI